MEDKELEYEKQKLSEILRDYREVLEDTQLMIQRLPELHRNDPRLLNLLMQQYQNKLRLMKQGEDKPYFARIDFQDEIKGKLYQCYLGKVGVVDYDNQIVIVDWRAPIASMYYDSNIGTASYEAPESTITGELKIKRQIDIENAELQRIQDVDTVSNDEILKPYLGVTADNRLKNIVSTIQSEQNEIIRERLGKNLIIQGVAGSGKTTVALHRTAYLAYNHRENIRPDQYMVIGPNRFFLDYISDVLPDLDASTVEQVTFSDFVQDFVGEELTINSSENQLIESLEKGTDLSVCKFKNSMQYKAALDRFITEIDSLVVPDKHFIVRDVFVLSKDFVKKIYYEIEKGRFPTIESRIERAILLLSANIDRDEKLKENIESHLLGLSNSGREFLQKELRNGFKASLKQHLSAQVTKKITNLYATFIKNNSKYIDDKEMPDKIVATYNANAKNGTYDFDDLAGLAYIKYNISSSGNYKKYRHVVVDEAQDFGDFNFLVLNQVFCNGTFSIFGDIAQSIYGYRSIENWDSVANQVFGENVEVRQLLKSYRTTIEIMDEANNIINHIGLDSATPVIRHGEDVGYYKIEHPNETIFQFVAKNVENGHKSIAVICKTAEEAINVQQYLESQNLSVSCIVNSNNKYNGGICSITAYLAKGLEFDAVVITNASELNYSSANDNDMKMLYVAMTRALHQLDVLYSDQLTKPLLNSAKKNSKNEQSYTLNLNKNT